MVSRRGQRRARFRRKYNEQQSGRRERAVELRVSASLGAAPHLTVGNERKRRLALLHLG